MSRPERLAAAFIECIREVMEDDELREIDRRNAAEEDRLVCHTHDFCDANVYMEEAFSRTFHYAPDVSSEEDAAVWNDAWNLAIEWRFSRNNG